MPSGPDERPGGFIVLHRRMLSWPLWQAMTVPQRLVWIEMLLEANWKASEVMVAEGRVVVHRGEFIAAQNTIAAQAQVSRKVVRQTYAHLLAEGAIRQRSIGTGVGTRRGRRVIATTIVNYSKYQDVPEREGRRGAAEGPHQNQENQGTKKLSPQIAKPQHPSPSDTRGQGRVIKFNPDDVLTVWDPVTETYVPRGLTALGRTRFGRG